MARAYLLSPKVSDAASLSASSAVGNAGVANLQKARPSLVWRSTTSTPYIEGDFGLAKTIDTLLQGYINAVSGDTFRLRLATSQANLTASPGYDSTALAVWPSGSNLAAYAYPHRAFAFTPQSYRWFRVDYGFSGNPAGYTQLARLMLGSRIEPATSVQIGWATGAEEPIVQTVDLGGEESPRPLGARRSLTLTWHKLTEAEKVSIEEMLLERGSAKDILAVIDPSEGNYPMSKTIIGRVKEAFSFVHQQLSGAGNPETDQIYTLALTVSELALTEMV